jgi:hypothetical protein
MKQSFPSVVAADGIVTIYFSDSAVSESLEIKCVVDMTDFADLLGIEVLRWGQQLFGAKIVAPSDSKSVRWTYDEDVDALYIRLRHGRSQIQKSTTCSVSLDESKHVICLQLSVPASTR